MRYLRTTFLPGMAIPPTTIVVSEADLTDTLESMERINHDTPGLDDSYRPLIITEIVTLDTDDLAAATLEIMDGVDQQHEQAMAILYFFLIDQVLPTLTTSGTYMAPDPAPLTEAEITMVFEQVVRHPHYEDQTCSIRTQDGDVTVEIISGRVRTTR